MEPPRPSHGRHPRCIGPASRPAVPAHQGRHLGAQLTRRRRPSNRDGRSRRAQRRPARAAALRQRCRAGRVHHLRRSRHRCVELGRAIHSECTCDLRSGSHEAVLHEVGTPNFLVRHGSRATFATRCKPALGARDRCHLPATIPSGRATTSKRALRTSSTPSFISITRAPSNRSNARHSGIAANRRRRTRRASDRYSALDRTDGDDLGESLDVTTPTRCQTMTSDVERRRGDRRAEPVVVRELPRPCDSQRGGHRVAATSGIDDLDGRTVDRQQPTRERSKHGPAGA